MVVNVENASETCGKEEVWGSMREEKRHERVERVTKNSETKEAGRKAAKTRVAEHRPREKASCLDADLKRTLENLTFPPTFQGLHNHLSHTLSPFPSSLYLGNVTPSSRIRRRNNAKISKSQGKVCDPFPRTTFSTKCNNLIFYFAHLI